MDDVRAQPRLRSARVQPSRLPFKFPRAASPARSGPPLLPHLTPPRRTHPSQIATAAAFHTDKLELKAVKDDSAGYAALEKKAELYEKLSRGELPDEEDKEKYCVDFFQKNFDHVYEPRQPESYGATDNAEPENDPDDSMPSAKLLGLGQTGTDIDRDEHNCTSALEVHEEVSEARQKASTMKSRRQEQEAACREKLRQAYLKKRLEKLTAEKQASSANDDQPAS